jgi:hypothetical protein
MENVFKEIMETCRNKKIQGLQKRHIQPERYATYLDGVCKAYVSGHFRKNYWHF